ncbi:hypothetical protein [Thiocapsa roseopersicina]|uniref:Uncharacterized protein n=1 Tax=Thiocapsa roseopersicina TaxID=1058 RepID=A0A1H3BSX2_THIRO|nr:hypothetical protein [Thiocapsa roseopersicina]SDX45112.1 hypothetical protein SAMN05421783_1275 [Thiocapsa roseopersicina]
MTMTMTMTIDGSMADLNKDMFREQFMEFVRDLDELSQCALLIGHAAIGYTPDIGCYLTDDLDDPDTVWSGGLTACDTRLIFKEMRTISRALVAAAEDFSDPRESGPDPHMVSEYVAAMHVMISILALVAYRRLHQEVECAYESYATRLRPPSPGSSAHH